MRTYTGQLRPQEILEKGIFVFGSNTQGRHGAGAAKFARDFLRAKYGQAKGLQGSSWAIVTKDLTKTIHPSISEMEIMEQIGGLYSYAEIHPEYDFFIAYAGKGKNLNGYTPRQMAEMFFDKGLGRIPDNIIFEQEFSQLVDYNNPLLKKFF